MAEVTTSFICFSILHLSKDVLWSVYQTLRSGLFGIAVISFKKSSLSEVDMRRLQLLAEQTGSSILLLSELPILEGCWALSFLFDVKRDLKTGVSACRVFSAF